MIIYQAPMFAGIPTEPNGGNHTPLFAKSSITEQAFEATLATAKALALSGLRILDDDNFYNSVSWFCKIRNYAHRFQVRCAFEQDRNQINGRP